MSESRPSSDIARLVDFSTIFAHMWYRDFPVRRGIGIHAGRADWTTHIGVAVRSTADLMGLMTRFESGKRTDALLRDNQGRAVAALEWEWLALHKGDKIVNEFGKLKQLCRMTGFKEMSFASLIGYARQGTVNGVDYSALSARVVEHYTQEWTESLPPLLLVVVEWTGTPRSRRFTSMRFYVIERQTRVLLRVQPACPWAVSGAHWSKPIRYDRFGVTQEQLDAQVLIPDEDAWEPLSLAAASDADDFDEDGRDGSET